MNMERARRLQRERRRRWYEKRRNDPEFMEEQRRKCREWRKSTRNDPVIKAKKRESDLRYQLLKRDDPEFRMKRSSIAKRWKEKHPDAAKIFREATRSWRQANLEAVSAHEAIRKAIRCGELTRPVSCSRCGNIPPLTSYGRSGIHAHHKDYKKPLEIEWICSFCHGNERRKYL